MNSRLRIAVISIAVAALAIGLMILANPKSMVLGFTYSPMYAEYLGLDPLEGFETIISEMPFDFVRIPVYWNRYEPLNDLWSTSELEQILNSADREHVDVILAIGQKVPRWPECFVPAWAANLSKEEYDQQFLEFTQNAVERLGSHPSVKRWQVENESYFPFGECKTLDPVLIQKETDIVREFGGGRPIQTTVSGEQGVGYSKASFADVVGFSLYRSVSISGIGKYTFPHTPFFYRVQKWLVAAVGKYPVISELQAEPWGVHEFDINNPEDAHAGYEAFTEENLKNQILFAKRTGMREISIWGVEWWLALAHHGEGRLWEGAKVILREL